MIRRIIDFLFGYDIFISYKHEDSDTYTHGLSKEFIKHDYRVFVDKSETIAGDQLTTTLKSSLKKSRSLVVIGTPAALKSNYVKLEIVEFLKLNRPVILIDIAGALMDANALKAAWPGTEDLIRVPEKRINHQQGTPSADVIQAIENTFHFTKRNKIRRRTVWTVGSLILLLAISISLLLFNLNKSMLQNQKTQVLAELEKDKLLPTNATDISRAEKLFSLLQRALKVGDNEIINEIKIRLSRIPAGEARTEILNPKLGRKEIYLSDTLDKIVLFSDDIVDVLSLKTGAIEFSTKYPRSGKYIWSSYDQKNKRIVFEVEYADIPDSIVTYTEENLDGGPSGLERELFFVNTIDKKLVSLGFSKKFEEVTVKTPPYDDDAISVMMAIPTGNKDTLLKTHFDNSFDSSNKEYGARFRQRLIAADGESGVYEYAAVRSEVQNVSRFFNMHPVLIDENGKNKELRTTGPYPHRSLTDTSVTQFPPYRDPIYEPAFLNSSKRVCLLNQFLIHYPLDKPVNVTRLSLDYSVISSVDFSSDIKNLIITYTDNTIGLYDVLHDSLLHKFPVPTGVVKTILDPNRRLVFTLRADGRIEQWDLTAFGPDGWAVQTKSQNRVSYK